MNLGDSRAGAACPPAPDDALAVAVRCHRSGRLAEAAAHYGRVLEADGANVAALHLLGTVHHQLGDSERATELIGRAAGLRPGVAVIQASLAEACLATGRHQQAADCARAALETGPDLPAIRCVLGLALQALGDPWQAERHLREAVRLGPTLAPAHSGLGDLLLDSDRTDEAVAYLRRAAEIEPGRAVAWSKLGHALLALGRPAEALPPFERAVRLLPGQAGPLDGLGRALASLGRLREAASAFLESIRLDPGLASTHHRAALALLQLDRFPDAERLLSHAAELAPNDPVVWEHLAEVRRALDRSDAAIPCWERVLALTPDTRARPHLVLGYALQEENRPEEAETHFRAAAAVEPGSAWPLVDLGGIYQDRGDFDEAEAAYRKAIRLDPADPMAYVRLGTLLGRKLPDADLEALKARAAEPGAAEGAQTRLLFALGHVLDARREYARAAGCLRTANERHLAETCHQRQFRPELLEQFVDGLIRGYDRDFFARIGGAGLDTRQPVFLVGLPRSGTTLVEQILASHPAVVGVGEADVCRRLVESLPPALGESASPAEFAGLLDEATVRHLAERCRERLRVLARHDAERIANKMLDNTFYLGFLLALFPNAQVIHCRRDLRDTALSCYATDFGNVYWANHPTHVATKFRSHIRLIDHWRATLPVAIHEVDYESIVADLEGEARRLIGALGLEWDPGCLDFHSTRRSVRTWSYVQVRQPLYGKSVGRWRHYEHELADLFAALPGV